MNILTEGQALNRQLALLPDGLFSGLTPDFLHELQSRGFFVEYNEQLIVSAGHPLDFLFCIISGRVAVLRARGGFHKEKVAQLGAGQWFGEISFFLRSAAEEDVRAESEVIVWAVPPETLRAFFFERPEAVQLLYNFAILLAQRVSLRSGIEVPASSVDP